MIKKEKFPDCVFFGGDQIFSQLCLCERNSNVRLFSQSVWVKQTRRRTSSWFCHENKCWASLTVCTECNLISSCICIQSLCDAQLVTGSVWSVWWVVEQDLIHLLILWQVTECLQLRHGSHSALLQQVCWWLPEGVRTWEVRSEPTAHTHTHTPVEYWLCVLCLFAALSWSVRWSLLSICLRRLRRTNVPSCTGCQVSVDTMLLLITSTCFISTMSDPRRRTPTEAQRAPMTYIKR